MGLVFKTGIEDKRKATAGEIIFDRTVYTGLGLVANEALAMLLAVEMRHFGGKETYLKASKWWQRTAGFKDKTQHGITTPGLTRAADSLEIFTLLASGTALIAPMKWMEDREEKIVRNINHLIDKLPGNHRSEEEVNARDTEVEKALACEPKQTWNSLILGRVIATVNNMAILKETVFAGERTQKVRDLSKKYVGRATDALHVATGKNPASPIVRIRKSERFKRYSEIFGLETLYTVASSVVLEVASKFIAAKKPAVKNPELCAQAQAEKQPNQANVTQPAASGVAFADKVSRKKLAEPASTYAQKIADESGTPFVSSP